MLSDMTLTFQLKQLGVFLHMQRAFSLDEIFATCDYITLHIPLTNQTKGIIGEHAVEMKRGMRLFNFSRGELVDEKVLQKH